MFSPFCIFDPRILVISSDEAVVAPLGQHKLELNKWLSITLFTFTAALQHFILLPTFLNEAVIGSVDEILK